MKTLSWTGTPRRAAMTFIVAAAAFGAGACTTSSPPTTPTPMVNTQDAPPPQPNPAPPAPAPIAPRAKYLVTFDSTWSRTTHPADFPDDAHYSGLIGGTHTSAVSFWQEGRLASAGIQAMAERGRKTPLDTEVMQAIAAGTAEFVLSGDALSDSPGVVTLEFEISSSFPLVTLVTMVAPSPDWFVGVSGLSLVENGQWVDERRVEVFAHDAGTDSGTTYAAPDEKTFPAQPIARITGYPINTNGPLLPLGTFTFRKVG